MPFLQRHGCHIDFSKSVMVMGHKELTCVDMLGRPLAGGIQVVQSCTIPGRSRATVHCKVDGGYSSGLEVAQSTHCRIIPAHSLNRLTRRGEIWVQYVPFLTGPIPSCPGGQRDAAGNYGGEPPAEPVYRAEGHPTPRGDAWRTLGSGCR